MDRLKRFALKKTAESLDKVLEAKAHFDKKEENKKYEKRLLKLKEVLNNDMFHDEEPIKRLEAYEKIQELNRIHSKHDFDSSDKRLIDAMIKEAGIKL